MSWASIARPTPAPARNIKAEPGQISKELLNGNTRTSDLYKHNDTYIQPAAILFGTHPVILDKNPINTAADHPLPLLIPNEPEFWINDRAEKLSHRRKSSNKESGGDKIVDQKKEPEKKTAVAKPSSWAALFSSTKSAPSNTAPTNAKVALNTAIKSQKESLSDALTNVSMVKTMPLIQPRGLVNAGNTCFMNVVFQSLLYCAPFYNALRQIREKVAFSFNSRIPLVESLIMFLNEFPKCDTKEDPFDFDHTYDIEPFVPQFVYDALDRKKIFRTMKGSQEDAQEFMGYLLDGIHEELMSAQCQDLKTKDTHSKGGQVEEGGDWFEVGLNNRTNVTRTVTTNETPITKIFGGSIRSTLHVPGQKPSSTLEPFQFLALDISSDNVYTLHSAFEELVHKEILECYMGINGTKVDATKQLTLESVPQVLVLHLKRFIFCPEKGIQKIHKFVAYRESFEISPQWVSRLDQHKIRNAKYELKTVIYHHGESAGGGHYTCDISRAPGEWVRFDDVDIDYLESEASVLCEKDDRHAYILFYQRVD